MNKKGFILFCIIISLCALTSCHSKDAFMKEYVQLTDKNHIMKYTTADEVITFLDSPFTGIIVFGFSSCPWCQVAVPYVNEIAKEKEYSVVYYLDIREMRGNENSPEHEKYLTIYQKIKEDIGSPARINAPTIVVFKNGTITGYSIDTVPSHIKDENNILPPMTAKQIAEIKELYRNMFHK